METNLREGYILDQETQEFYDEIVESFLELRAGHIGRYCFSNPLYKDDRVRGDEHWTQFIHECKSYYPYRHQIEIIRQSARQIGEYIAEAGTFVDLGTGSLNSFEHKILPILKAGRFKKLTFVDLCTTFSKIATARLKQENLHIATNTFIGNFFNELPALSEKAVISLFGITLGNIIVDLPRETPEQVLARTMKHFAAPLSKHGGYFVFDYDTNTEARSIQAGYEHPAYHAMEMTIFERVKRDLPTEGFDPEDFEHITVWHPEWSLLAHEIRAKRDVRFRLGKHIIEVPCGKSFRTGSSFKYSDAVIERTANQAGFTRRQVFTIPGSTMRVAVYEIEPRLRSVG